MKYDELPEMSKMYALRNEIKFQILTEDRPDAIAYNGKMDELYANHKGFFEDCCRQDEFNSSGTIIKAK
jgi:hypothetical protein